MHQSTDEPQGQPVSDPREISKWARVYGQNRRSVAVVIGLLVCMLLFFAISGFSYLAGQAYRDDNMPLFLISVAILVATSAATIYIAVPPWCGRLVERLIKRFYASEGNVELTVPVASRRPWFLLLAVAFAACILAMVRFGDYIPAKYHQPVSALYVVPFLVGLTMLMRPAVGLVLLAWAALFALHAILIVAGAPILFAGRWESLNTLIPMAGYGILVHVISHVYSRFALRRLRSLVKTDDIADHRPHEATGQ